VEAALTGLPRERLKERRLFSLELPYAKNAEKNDG